MKNRYWYPVLACCIPAAAYAQTGQMQSDFGGVGLMQTPTARMAPVGEVTFSFNRAVPYERYNLSTQPLSWLEFGIRYARTTETPEGFDELVEGNDYLNNGIDTKLLLNRESATLPQLAVGFRNLGGASLFRSEYLVASKRWYDFDFSLGLGWGYLAGDDDLDEATDNVTVNPDGSVSASDVDDFSVSDLFSGSPRVFGGIEYQTPWQPLRLALEYDANDYDNEPLKDAREQDSHVNYGAHYQLTDNIDMHAGWERGSTFMWGVSLSTNLAGLSQAQDSTPPEKIDSQQPSAQTDWQETSDRLADNAGFDVHRITRNDDTLTLEGESRSHRSWRKTEGRANRILTNRVDPEISTFRYRQLDHGLVIRDDFHDRQDFMQAVRSDENATGYEKGIYARTTLQPPQGETVASHFPDRLRLGVTPHLLQNAGGQDGYLYQLFATADAELFTDRRGWFSGEAGVNVADNLDRYEYRDNGKLHRVRSRRDDYLDESSVGLYNLQYTRVAQLDRDWSVMAYGGLLEMMYAGAGGEVLYRPLESSVALGMDINWVKQRDFDQGFGTRDYDAWTGQATAYIDTGYHDVLAKVSAGRYLAKDWGGTLDLSREFVDGARIGAWATFTDANDDFDQGDFNRGVYISVPLDAFFSGAGDSNGEIAWQPLMRDSGATLDRRYRLYEMTRHRDMDHYWQDNDASYE
ncbi:exopolysaccharide biosynthesis protein YbjH [Kushneria sinocarnis]|uniref:Exopolysaccharide biosynthesis protein YbjH n=1 Tax=Kushneria sinocarnis TaxID=595502 RepID=A0A420WXW3_9GAMM|nr:YjbH domain-containing protein [Kushneria sinocarnis]RKR06043.1 exopolysaccharide biosynthesis protein YbjH [Kushneria sinocarnis]